jgi:Leucine-rich repeat (LRR) protein
MQQRCRKNLKSSGPALGTAVKRPIHPSLFAPRIPAPYPSRMSTPMSIAQARIDAWLVHGDPSEELDLSSLGLETLPPLPDTVALLLCGNNRLTELPDLPSSLSELRCSDNQLTRLPAVLPSSLLILDCVNNKLTALPEKLPASLEVLVCDEGVKGKK